MSLWVGDAAIGSDTVNDAHDVQSSAQIGDLTARILQKSVSLERLNTTFRLQTGLVSPWRQRRVFLYGEANAGLTEASQIEAMVPRFQLARAAPEKPGRKRPDFRGRLATSASVQLVANSVGGAGDIIEGGLNYLNYLQIKRRGLNPKVYKQRAFILHTELDELLHERDEQLAHAPALTVADKEVANQEGKLLCDFRDLCLLEYAEYHAATNRFWMFQNTAFFVDFLKNATGGVGNVVSLTSNHWRQPRLQGVAGILSTTSGVILLFQPFVGRATGNLAGLASKRLISRELTNVSAKDSNTFRADRLRLIEMAKQNGGIDPSLQGRLSAYAVQEKLLADTERFFAREKKQAKATTVENIAFAAAVGPLRIANGITQIDAAWQYHNRPKQANRIYAAGATCYAIGSGINILETARVQAGIEMSNYELGRKGMLPSQQLKERLALIERMKDDLK